MDLTKGRQAKHCVWALTGTVGQIISPSVPLKPLTQYMARLVYQAVGPSNYTLAGDVDGKIVTDWSEPVVTFSKQLSERCARGVWLDKGRPSGGTFCVLRRFLWLC